MTFPITKTADHSVSVGSLASTPIAGEHIFPTYLVTSDATAISAANPLHVQPGTGVTWAVSAASLPLPSGAATSAKQDSQTTHLATLAGAVSGTEVQVDVLTMPTVTIQDGGGSITVDGSVSVSGSVAVTDNSGSLTVDAPVGTPVFVRLSDGTSAISTLPVSIAAAVAVTDNSGSLTVDDGGSSLTVDGSVSISGSVAVTDNSGSLTVDAPVGTPVFVRLSDGTAAISTLPVSIASAVAVTDNSGSLTVDNAGTFAVQAAQSGTWTVGLSAGTNGIGKLTANSGVTIGAVEIAASQTLATVTTVTTVTTVSTLTGGGVAHDGVDSGNPVKIGFKASSSLAGATMVTSGDRVDAVAGVDGAQIVRPHCGLEDIVSGVAAITDGSSTSVIAAQGAGVKTYITTVVVANTSATAVTVDLRDGAAGTVKLTLPVPANTAGVVLPLPVPLPFSANTAVCADPSASASTVTVTLIGFKSKV